VRYDPYMGHSALKGFNPHSSLVDYLNIVYKLCLTVIKIILVLFIIHTTGWNPSTSVSRYQCFTLCCNAFVFYNKFRLQTFNLARPLYTN
jgi:hypothetical protein